MAMSFVQRSRKRGGREEIGSGVSLTGLNFQPNIRLNNFPWPLELYPGLYIYLKKRTLKFEGYRCSSAVGLVSQDKVISGSNHSPEDSQAFSEGIEPKYYATYV